MDLEHEWFSSPVLGFMSFPSGIWQQPDKVIGKQLLFGFNEDISVMKTNQKNSVPVQFLSLFWFGFFSSNILALVSGSVHQPLHFRKGEPHLTSNALFQTCQCFRSETFKVWSVWPITFYTSLRLYLGVSYFLWLSCLLSSFLSL